MSSNFINWSAGHLVIDWVMWKCPNDQTTRCHDSLQPHAIEGIPVRHVRENHLIADVQSRKNLDRVDRGGSELHLHPSRRAVGVDLEEPGRALFLPERGTADIQHVAPPLEPNRAVG